MYESEITAAAEKSPIARAAINHVLARTMAMHNDQLKILESLKFSRDNGFFDDASGQSLANEVTCMLRNEKLYFAAFDKADKKSMLLQIAHNKMSTIINQTLAYLGTDETVVTDILDGIAPADDSFHDLSIPVLGTATFWGSNNATIYTSALLAVAMATRHDTINDWMQTSVVHVTAATAADNLPLSPHSKYLYRTKWCAGFGFVHGGYAFGGQRGEIPLVTKDFGPEDCSTFVAKMTGSSVLYTTDDQFNAWRSIYKTAGIAANWQPSPLSKYFDRTFTPLSAASTVDKLLPGDIHLVKAEDYGHTTIVLGPDPSKAGNVLTLGFSRDLERENPDRGIWGKGGAGIESYPVQHEQVSVSSGAIKKTMFLRPR